VKIQPFRSLGHSGFLVAALALLAYLPGSWWGAPTATAPDRVQSWGVDDETPLGPLAEMDNILHAKPDRNLGYPLLYDFLTVGAYTPYLAILAASGQMSHPSAAYPFGLANPIRELRVLSHLAHLLTVLLGVVVVLAAFLVARTLWDSQTGVLSAVFVLSLYPMFYYARTGNVDVPMLACLALALAALASSLVHGMSLGRTVWIGVFAGLALATKEEAIGALVPAGMLVLVLGSRTAGWKVPLVTLAAATVALGVGSGFFVDPQRWVDHVRFIAGRVQETPHAQNLTSAYPFTMAGNLGFAGAILQRLLESLSLPGLLLACWGLVLAARKDRNAVLFALAIPAYFAMEFLLMRSTQLRYVLPVAFLLAIFAGRALRWGWQSRYWAPRLAAALLAIGALFLQLTRATALTYEMLHDSRLTAGAWLAARLAPGDRVEYFGASQKLPPLSAEVITERATPYFGMWGQHPTGPDQAASILERWRHSPPRYVLVIPDHTSRPNLPYDASVPPTLYDSLVAGTAGFRLAALIQTAPLLRWPRRPPLDYPSVNPPIRVFEPVP
jgi:4-amino-4-deoxy-L-arabinose transferase-like glycosyltransferase